MSKRVAKLENEVPLWLVASLGKKVAIVNDYDSGRVFYPAGSEGILMAIRGADMPSLSVDVCLDRDDPDVWERFVPSEIRPPSQQITFELDIHRGVIAF